jgi:hypothetical protein
MMIGAGALLYYVQRDAFGLAVITLITLAMITLPGTIMNGIVLFAKSTDPAIDAAGLRIDQLNFIKSAVTFLLAAGLGIFVYRKRAGTSPLTGLYLLTIFGLLAIQTMRTSFRASYINYDNATEYLVYAHGATGVKDVLAQVTEISERTAGGLNGIIAYDASAPDTGVSWPVVWYLRDFTALRSFDQPSRSLREATAVIVDQKNFDKIEPALGDHQLGRAPG